MKNKTSRFKQAISEIKAAIDEQIEMNSNENDQPTTLKGMPVTEIIETFNENEEWLGKIFEERRYHSDHLNRGKEFDYISFLYHTVTSEQQQEMFKHIRKRFTMNYYEHPIVRKHFKDYQSCISMDCTNCVSLF